MVHFANVTRRGFHTYHNDLLGAAVAADFVASERGAGRERVRGVNGWGILGFLVGIVWRIIRHLQTTDEGATVHQALCWISGEVERKVGNSRSTGDIVGVPEGL